MNTIAPPDRLAALRDLTLLDVERRILSLESELAALAVLRRSMRAKERAARRAADRLPTLRGASK